MAEDKRNDDSELFGEAGPSKAFTSSTIRISTSRVETPSSVSKRKVSIRKLSIEAPNLPMNDDSSELIEEKERSLAELEKSINKSSNKTEEEPDISILKTMTEDQMREHMSRCLQLNTENKINTKNAFALKLIDCMTMLTKTDEKNNFAVMAYQLDAGAKIYSSRVDAVHQQVMKLVETCMFAAKKNEKQRAGEESEEDEGEGEEKNKKSKKPRKKVLATRNQISRQPKENDPKDRFVRLEALPGDILNKAKYSSDDLSLTLENDLPYWTNWENYKPTKAEGYNEIPDIEVKTRKMFPQLESELDLTSIPKLESLFLPKSQAKEEEEYEDDGEEVDFNSSQDFSIPDDDDENAEIEMVSLAKTRMTNEGSNIPTTTDVVKTIFHEPGDSEYHYLKTDSFHFWAGPSHWKRPQGHIHAENKKKGMRRKREPVEVTYTEGETEKVRNAKASRIGANSKRASALAKRTMAKWSDKKVTYPLDIHFEPESFHMLFSANILATIAAHEKDDSAEEDFESRDNVENDDYCGTPDMFDSQDNDSEGTGFKGFPSPTNSIADDQEGFKGFSSPGCSQFEPGQGFSAFYSQESDQVIEYPILATTGGSDMIDQPTSSCDVYEGENLVPMVKTVKVEPIRIKAKPNRVDMQHLKCVMLNIIRHEIEDRENGTKREGSSSPRGSVAFREVLTQLFNSDDLHHRTRDDLTVQMAFLCLLTLANENCFNLKKDDTDDFLIMYHPSVV